MSTRHITRSITLPDGDVLVIRKLSGKHLRQAAEAQLFEYADLIERVAEMQARLKAATASETPSAPVAPDPAPVAPVSAPDPMQAYSARAMILTGMLSVEGETFPDEAAREAWVDDLSQEDLDFAGREILRLASPKLFLSADAQAVAEKNDSSVTIGR